MNSQKPCVSVVMITYGHEKYIEEAINGVFIQKTDFPIELIIANDCSPDKTDEIVRKVIQRSPENITVRYICHEQNKGMMPNFIWALKQTKGKYIALCEGDDYWTDPLKLQKQVDFLEQNEEYVLICTNSQNTLHSTEEKDITVFDLLHHNPIKTLTTVYRNLNIELKFLENKTMGDIQLWLNLIKFGKFKFIPDSTAFYRVLMNSASGRGNVNTRLKFFQDRIDITNYYIENFKLSKAEKKTILQDQYSCLIMASLKVNKLLGFKAYLISLKKTKSINLTDIKILKNFI